MFRSVRVYTLGGGMSLSERQATEAADLEIKAILPVLEKYANGGSYNCVVTSTSKYAGNVAVTDIVIEAFNASCVTYAVQNANAVALSDGSYHMVYLFVRKDGFQTKSASLGSE